ISAKTDGMGSGVDAFPPNIRWNSVAVIGATVVVAHFWTGSVERAFDVSQSTETVCRYSSRDSSQEYPGSVTVPTARTSEVPRLATTRSPGCSSTRVHNSLAFLVAV